MWLAALMVLTLQAASRASAFVATPVRWQSIGILWDQPTLRPPAAPAVASAAAPSPPVAGRGAGALLAGALAALAATLGSSRSKARGSRIGRCGWSREPAFPGMERDGDPSRGPSYRTWINRRRQNKFGTGKRQRFYRQQKILAESGLTCANEGWHKWYPNRDSFNLYKGPESHPDNPHFPAASSGYQALPTADPPRLAASPESSRPTGVFVAGRVAGPAAFARRWAQGGRSSASALVLRAHKKAASSTRNQGHKNNPHYWGLTKKGHQGAAVKAGDLLVKQKGFNWYPGANVSRGKDYSLHSIRDGIVQWRGPYKSREVFVVPWEYVRTRCVWINPNTLGPKVYEPWMGNRRYGKRDYILKLRREYLETEEGKEWMNKKEEKRQKQNAIMKKIRARVKLRQAGKVPAKAESELSDVAAGGAESEGESETES